MFLIYILQAALHWKKRHLFFVLKSIQEICERLFFLTPCPAVVLLLYPVSPCLYLIFSSFSSIIWENHRAREQVPQSYLLLPHNVFTFQNYLNLLQQGGTNDCIHLDFSYCYVFLCKSGMLKMQKGLKMHGINFYFCSNLCCYSHYLSNTEFSVRSSGRTAPSVILMISCSKLC